MGAVAANPAGAAAARSPHVNSTAPSWSLAAARLGTAGSLWEPGNSVGLKRTKPVEIIADGLTFAAGAAITGDTYAGARYGSTAGPSFTIAEKWANTGWAAEPATSTSLARVGTARIALGTPGTQVRVTAQVLANCFVQPTNADPKDVPAGYRCSKADVMRTGGVLRMTARPSSTMTEPGRTSIVITTKGLTYEQLLAIAGSLAQVSGGGNDGAGSAQMVAMCAQMVDGRMDLATASAFADSNGYTVRTGSIDGQPQMVTMDFRWNRFTVDLVKGAVTGCTFG